MTKRAVLNSQGQVLRLGKKSDKGDKGRDDSNINPVLNEEVKLLSLSKLPALKKCIPFYL